MGGLGNQLFQIFTTISYAISCKQQFKFLYRDFNGNRKTYWNTFLINLKIFTELQFPKMKTVKENGFNFENIPKNNETENTLLYGYFQSYKYFEENFKSICKLIQLENQKNNIKNTYIYDYNNSVSIHFRLGDYKKLIDYHPVLNYDYYKNSIQYIISTKEKNKFDVLYFCEKEDNEIVVEIIQNLKTYYSECNFIKVDDKIEDWIQMLIMSLCKYNIIANSTFSWWAAYFNSNMDKIICYPEMWFGPKLSKNNTNDLFPDNWIKISVK